MSPSVLHVVRTADGGMRHHLNCLCDGLTKHGWDVSIAGPENHHGLPSQHFFPTPISDGFHPLEDWAARSKLRKTISSGRWDLLHVHGWKAGLLAAASRRPMSQLPVLITLHNQLPPQYTGWKWYLARCLAAGTIKKVDGIICVSHALANLVLDLFPAARGKLHVIENGINVARIEAGARRGRTQKLQICAHLQIPPDVQVVGTVARLIAEKGLFDLVEAFATVRKSNSQAMLVVIGDGPARAQLEETADRLKLRDSVRFLGWRIDVPVLLGLMDVFVLPSWSEGLPLTVLEAMAAQVPVIATAVGGIPQVIRNSNSGLLVPPRACSVLADTILKLLQSPDLAKQLANEAYHTVKEHLDTKTMIAKTLQIYERLISRS